MTTLNLLINQSPLSSPSHHRAIRFCNAVVKQTTHHIATVFFMQSAVEVALNSLSTQQDEFDYQNAWIELAQQHAIKLQLCPGAATRRSIDDSRIVAPFEFATLGQFLLDCQARDRTLQFG